MMQGDIPHHFSDYGFDPQIDYFQVLHSSPILPSFLPFPLQFDFPLCSFPANGRSKESHCYNEKANRR
ncbi:hypothetical protein LINPERPRIM_LOCUS13821 [Linum perenne]